MNRFFLTLLSISAAVVIILSTLSNRGIFLKYSFDFAKGGFCDNLKNSYTNYHDLKISNMYSLRSDEIFIDVDGDGDQDLIKMVKPKSKVPYYNCCIEYIDQDTIFLLVFKNDKGDFYYSYRIDNITCTYNWDIIWYEIYKVDNSIILEGKRDKRIRINSKIYLSFSFGKSFIDSAIVEYYNEYDEYRRPIDLHYSRHEMPTEKFDRSNICIVYSDSLGIPTRAETH